MAYPHGFSATTIRLADGRVLVVGGGEGVGAETAVEIYDPATGLFSAAPAPLGQRRFSPAAAVLDSDRILVIGDSPDGLSSSAASAEVLALDGDAGLPAGCCPQPTRDVEVNAGFAAGDLDVPEGGRVEAVVNGAQALHPVSIRAFIHSARHPNGEMVDVPVPSGCSGEIFAPATAGETDPPSAMAPCEFVVPLGQTDFAELTLYFSYDGEPPIEAESVTVSFRLADGNDQ
jgi:hypothetical protein